MEREKKKESKENRKQSKRRKEGYHFSSSL